MGLPFAKPLAESGYQVPLHTDGEPVTAGPALPVCTSSLMKTPPWMRTIRDDLKYSWGGVMKPPTLWIGSAMNPATLPQVEPPTSSSEILHAFHCARGIGEAGQR